MGNTGRYLKIIVWLFLVMLPFSSGSTFITGNVGNALDGTETNGRTVLLWNPAIGKFDNIGDTIGFAGNSGLNNSYLIDCELLNRSCTSGDILAIQVVNSGDNYMSEISFVSIPSASGYLNAPFIKLRVPSQVNISSVAPLKSNLSVSLGCIATHLDGIISSLDLFGDWTGKWQIQDNANFSSAFAHAVFQVSPRNEGIYNWACGARDSLGRDVFSKQNGTIVIDKTVPIIMNMKANVSSTRLNVPIRLSCNAHDALSGIDKVFITARGPRNFTQVYLASQNSADNYGADIRLGKSGKWTFSCSAKDYVNNTAFSTSDVSVVVKG